jgi:1-acyl-sn-glycerol-3-phosphate acyltransferase
MPGKIFNTLLSLPVYAVLYLFTFILVSLGLICSYVHLKKVVRVLIRIWAYGVFIILLKRLHVKGKEYIEPGRNYILLANHSCAFDISAIMAVFSGVSWFGREYLLRIPLFGHFLKTINFVPMKVASLRHTKMALGDLVHHSYGNSIGIFPEGTRTVNGKLGRFHKGFVYLMRESGLDLLPVTLNGFFRLKPKTRMVIDFGSRVEVVIHPPIPKDSLKDMKDDAICQLVKQTIESAYLV